MYEFPRFPECSVTPHRVLAERLLRTVRRQVSEDLAPEFPALSVLRPAYCVPAVLRAPEFSSSASSSSALRKIRLRSVASDFVEVRRVSASRVPSVQCVLRQAFSRVAVPRSRPAKVSSSVAFSVLTSPTFSTPKRILSSALHISKRAAQAEKSQRIGQRLAQLRPVASR